MIQNSAWEVGYWSGGAPVGKKYPNSSRPLIPARRPGRVGSRRDPSDGQVNLVVPFLIPLPRRGAGAFIVSVVDHSYLITLLLLWPTMSSYPSTTLVIPALSGLGFPINRGRRFPAFPRGLRVGIRVCYISRLLSSLILCSKKESRSFPFPFPSPPAALFGPLRAIGRPAVLLQAPLYRSSLSLFPSSVGRFLSEATQGKKPA
ncbi:hypothetical protein B296_00023091 [Ensete ventricosum]|uniref:Uncharacterized protein n=1 Tax=Ensete ventricosum TaxID=4639 RepID=A0A426ZC20_ENSVE|nr:hypothetical protein B296_00023091 [Ensete ventricosum]